MIRVVVPAESNKDHPCSCRKIWRVTTESIAAMATRKQRAEVASGVAEWKPLYVCRHSVERVRGAQ